MEPTSPRESGLSSQGVTESGSFASTLLRAVVFLRKLDSDMEAQCLHVLLILATRTRPILMQELGYLTELSQSSVSRNVQKLGDMDHRGRPGYGFVEVSEDPYDHRNRLVVLNRKGRAWIARLEDACRQ